MAVKLHYPGARMEPLALGPGGSAGSVEVPITLCGTYGYGVEYASDPNKVSCKSCLKTKAYKRISVAHAQEK